MRQHFIHNKKQLATRLLLTISVMFGIATAVFGVSHSALAEAATVSNNNKSAIVQFAANIRDGCPTAGGGGTKGAGEACFTRVYIDPFIVFFSICIGTAVTISIVVGGIQYASSADDPGKVSAAKNRIITSIVALLAYIFLLGLLRYLIPGGL